MVQGVKINLIEEIKVVRDKNRFAGDEWIVSDHSHLSNTEITFINTLLANIGQAGIAMPEEEETQYVIQKLKFGYELFKDVVLVQFFCALIELARQKEKGYDPFFVIPIQDLKIASYLKECLLKFKVHTIDRLFFFYRLSDFKVDRIFAIIIDFQIAYKNLSSVQSDYFAMKEIENIYLNKNFLEVR